MANLPPIAETPASFLNDIAAAAAKARSAPKSATRSHVNGNGKRYGEKQRYPYLNKMAYRFRCEGLGLDQIYTAIAELNEKNCDPPHDEAELRRIVKGVEDVEAKEREPVGADGDSYIVDTMQVAQRFTDVHGSTVRFTEESGRWYQWNGQYYEPLTPCRVFEIARIVCREVSLRPENARSRSWIASPACVAGVEKLARGREEHCIKADQWDADPWLLNTPAGVVDLRTGSIRPGYPEDYCSKITAVAPLPSGYRPEHCPLWLKFLDRATEGNKELEAFLRRMAGYCLTGIIREHALFFFYGTGGNGKGTFMNATRGAMGDYATTAAMATLIATDIERHRPAGTPCAP